MKIYLGTDIVYIPRIRAALDRFGERFLQRVYTLGEQQDCRVVAAIPPRNAMINRTTVNQLAGRWAAKEAVAKALGTGWQGIGYTDIEIQRQPSGVPQVILHRTAAVITAPWGCCQWQLSLSHDGDYAIATAICLALS